MPIFQLFCQSFTGMLTLNKTEEQNTGLGVKKEISLETTRSTFPHLGQSVHMSLFLNPTYKPFISRMKHQTKTVQI